MSNGLTRYLIKQAFDEKKMAKTAERAARRAARREKCRQSNQTDSTCLNSELISNLADIIQVLGSVHVRNDLEAVGNSISREVEMEKEIRRLQMILDTLFGCEAHNASLQNICALFSPLFQLRDLKAWRRARTIFSKRLSISGLIYAAIASASLLKKNL